MPAWIRKYIHHKARGEITYTFPIFNGEGDEDLETIISFTPFFTGCVITCPYCDQI